MASGSQEYSWKTSTVYSLPHLPTTFLFIPTTSILMGVYAKHFGISLTTIAAVLFFGRLFDAVTDPLIGVLSDRHQRKYGTRKPFLLLGGIGFSIAAWFLYSPSGPVSTTYFAVCVFAFYLFWTVFEIPHISWGSELARNSSDKTRIYAVRGMVGGVGTMLFFLLPLLPLFPTTEITPDVLEFGAAIMSVSVVILTLYTLKKIPDGRSPVTQAADSLRSVLSSVLQNKPLLILIGGFFFAGMSFGMWSGLNFIFIDSYLGLGGEYALIQLVGLPLGIAALSAWSTAAGRYGKKRVWMFGLCSIAVTIGASGMLEPGDDLFVQLVIVQLLAIVTGSSFALLAQSILADIVDYGTWKFGVDRSATYFSSITVIGKANNSIGIALGLFVAGQFGFDATETVHSESAVFGLKLGYAVIPVVFCGLAILLVSRIPLSERNHRAIRRRLDLRAINQDPAG